MIKQDTGFGITQFYKFPGTPPADTPINMHDYDLAPPVEWFSSVQWGVALVDHNGVETQWGGNFGSSGTQFTVPPVYESAVNARGLAAKNYDSDTPKSSLDISTTTYLFFQNTSLGEQSFYTTLGRNQYIVPACPNFEPSDCPQGGGVCGAPGAAACPKRAIPKGAYKLSVMGVLSGAEVNSLRPKEGASFSADGLYSDVQDAYRNIANYTSFKYRSILDLGSMGAPGAIHAWVSDNNDANLTMNLTSVPPTMNLAHHTVHIWGEQHGGFKYKFVPYYSSGTFARDTGAAVCSPSTPHDDNR